MMKEYGDWYKKSYEIKKRYLALFSQLGYGHLTTTYSETEIMIWLLEEIMNFDGSDEERDRLVISKGHGAGILFPILEDMGLLSEEDAMNMLMKGQDYTKFQQYYDPGFHFYGGSLGIGFGMAAGLAMGAKLNRENKMVFCLVGDAECYEGSVWEAMLFAGHNRLNNLVVIVDRNFLGCSDFTENMCKLEPFEDKWKSCNWETKVINGHFYEELASAFSGIRSRKSSQPLCIIAETVKGNGVDYASNKPLMHAFMPKGEDVQRAEQSLEKEYRREMMQYEQ